jgi:hypothetical protein
LLTVFVSKLQVEKHKNVIGQGVGSLVDSFEIHLLSRHLPLFLDTRGFQFFFLHSIDILNLLNFMCIIFLPLGAIARGELWPPEQSASILSEADYVVSEQFSFYGVRLVASRPTPNLEDQGIPLRLAPTP